MRKTIAALLCALLIMSATGCVMVVPNGKESENKEPALAAAVTPTSSSIPGGGGNGGQDEPEPPSQPTPTAAPIPPDSMWTLKGEITHRLVLETGYYADFFIELDFAKLEGAYPSGRYQGDVYMTLKIDAEDFIKEMLKNVPKGVAGINFDVEGYGLRTLVPITVFNMPDYRKDGKTWPSMHTLNAQGGQVNPGEGEYVADTSFLMDFKSTGSAGGWGNTGAASFKLGDFDLSGEGDGDFKIRLIIEPDSVWGNDFYTGTGGTRKVQIFIDADGTAFSGEGTLTRQPNSADNTQKYINRERLGEKHGADETG